MGNAWKKARRNKTREAIKLISCISVLMVARYYYFTLNEANKSGSSDHDHLIKCTYLNCIRPKNAFMNKIRVRISETAKRHPRNVVLLNFILHFYIFLSEICYLTIRPMVRTKSTQEKESKRI